MSTYDDFIIAVLNIDSNRIKKIDVLNADKEVATVKVTLNDEGVACPVCRGNVSIHGYNDKKLIHSMLNNRECYIVYRQTRYYCKSCDMTFSAENPFAERNERVTHETKLNILKDLKRVDNTYTYVGIKNSVSPTEVQKIFDRYVNIERHPLPTFLSVDENYFPESDYDSLYICVFMNFDTGEIVDVLPDRKKDYLISYLSNIKNETLDDKTHRSELNNVQYISIDLNDIYRDVFSTYFPKALICADSFHVIKNLTFFFNKVRIRCRRNCDDDILVYLLTKFDFVFNHDQNLDNEPKYNKRLERYINYRGIRDYMFEAFPELQKAYDLKERYIEFNSTSNLSNAKEGLAEMIKLFYECGIKEYEAFYNLLINWYQEIINSFTRVNGRRINNSYIESKNKCIDRLMYNANGFLNFRRTRNRIMYCINKNDTYKF